MSVNKRVYLASPVENISITMPLYCCVPLCRSNKGGHKFPQDEDLTLKWRVAIKRIDETTKKLWMPGPQDVVCCDHFTADDYKDTLLGAYLSQTVA